MNHNQIKKELFEIAQIFEAGGLRCYGSDNRAFQTYITFGDDTGVGYLQYHDLEGWKFSTEHKPYTCSGIGTGFGNLEIKFSKRVEAARAVMAMHAPMWASGSDREAVRKWSSIDEYLAQPMKNGVRIVETWEISE